MIQQQNWIKLREDRLIEQRRTLKRRLAYYRKALQDRLPEHPWPDPVTEARAGEFLEIRRAAYEFNRLVKSYPHLQVEIPTTPDYWPRKVSK